MNQRLMGRFAAIAVVVLLSFSGLNAQVSTANVDGVITDSSGKVIVGAQVTMVETDKALTRQTTTGADGRFVLANLPVGPYRLEVRSPGFKDYKQTGITLQVGSSVTLNATLTVGAVTETVEVMAVAQMAETRENGVAQVIDERKIEALPLNGRQPTQLVLLTGASVQPPGGNSMTGSKNYSSSTTISVGGGQVNGTAYLLDGGDHTDTMTNVNLPFPFPDALQEFSVETSALSAKFGTHPGATVNAVTKSGTNSLHGTLFEFLRNGNTNARNYFAPVHDSLKRNTFGGTIGGKVIQDKVFFFGGYQGLRNRSQPPTLTNYIPTAAALTGDLSGMVTAGCGQAKANLSGQNGAFLDPLTQKAFPNNVIPGPRLNPASIALAKYLPVSQADSCGRIQYGIPQTGDENQFISRVDWVQSTRHAVYTRYFSAGYANPPVYNGQSLLTTTTSGNFERVQSATIGDTFSISPTTLNSAHITFARRRDDRGPAPNQIGPRDIGINMFQKVPNFLLVTVTNFFSVGCGTCAPGHFNVNSWTFGDDVDLVRGRHHIAIGANIVRTQNNLISGFNENANIQINTDSNGAGTAASSTGYAMADYLLGRLGGSTPFNQSNPTPDDLRQTIISAYVQDTFKWNNRVTLNAGLRWEPFLPNNDKYLRGGQFDRAAFDADKHSTIFPNAPAGLFFPNDPGYSKSQTHAHLMSWGPRAGLVFNPHGDGRDSLRIGGAILYDTTEMFFDERKTTNPPYGSSVGLSSGAPSTTTVGPFNNPYLYYPGGSPFPAPNLFPLAGAYIQLPLDTKPTYLVQWNASYQRQIKSWLVSVSYLGNKTTHLWVGSEINPCPPSTTTCSAARRLVSLANAARGQYYGSINQADEGANAHYNALLVSLQHRFSHGFTLLTNYTHSSCISDLDFTGELGGSPNSQYLNRGADRGPCNFDYKRVFNLSMVAQSSFKRGNAFTNRLLSEWQLSPIIRAVSGGPFSVTSGTDNSKNGTNNDRPNIITSNAYQATAVCPASTPYCTSYLTAAATGFQQNAIGTYGTLGRNAFRGPGALSVDLALSRAFKIMEKYTLEARFDAFNVINRANFSNPAANLNSPATFGLITSTVGAPSGSLLLPSVGDPRILQFALKLKF